MKPSVEIRSSAFPYDMSSWCTEKMSTVVLDLARIVEALNNRPTASGEVGQAILDTLYPALYNATKMLAFSCGADWAPSDRDIIVQGGVLGYEKLQVKYGIIREVAGQERVFEPMVFVSRCRELLAGERAPSRTLMHDLLRRVKFKEPVLQDLEDELERVTMGTLEWSEFVPHALDILTQIEKKTETRTKA